MLGFCAMALPQLAVRTISKTPESPRWLTPVMKKRYLPGMSVDKNARVIVIVTFNVGTFHAPPAGDSVKPGGKPCVRSTWVLSGSLINVSIHCNGYALTSANVAFNVGGCCWTVVKASVAGAPVTIGLVISVSSGGSGGAGRP